MDKKKILEQLKSFKTDESKCLFMVEYIEKITEDYENFKDVLEDRAAKIIRDVFQNDLGLNKQVLEWASIGRQYEQWIDRFKGRLIRENFADGEAIELLKISKCEIQTLRKNIAAAKRSTTMVKDDIKKMSKELFVHGQLDEMKINNISKQKVKKILLEGDALKGLDEYNINKKIKMLLEKD